jgi:hypothetical protein
MGKLRSSNNIISTVVSTSRYKEKANNTLNSLMENSNNKNSIKKKITELPSSDSQVTKYTQYILNYKPKVGKSIPMTSFYVIEGEIIPVFSNKTPVLPIKENKGILKYLLANVNKLNKANVEGLFPFKRLSGINQCFYLPANHYTIELDKNGNKKVMFIEHTHPKHIKQLNKFASNSFESFKKTVKDPTKKDEAFCHACKTIWLVANICPFFRGSSWAAEVLGTSMFRQIKGYENIDLKRSNIDFLAFGNPVEVFTHKLKMAILLQKEKKQPLEQILLENNFQDIEADNKKIKRNLNFGIKLRKNSTSRPFTSY